MTYSDARQTALYHLRRIQSVTTMLKAQPGLVHVAQDGNTGDQIAFWIANGQNMEYNLTDAQRKIYALAQQHGDGILKSRSGQVVKIELPL